MCWQIFTPDPLPDATPKGFRSLPRIELEIFLLLGDCVNLNTQKNRCKFNSTCLFFYIIKNWNPSAKLFSGLTL